MARGAPLAAPLSPLAGKLGLQVADVSFQERLRADTLKTLYAYWQDLRGDRPAPARADIDPSAIPKILPHIGLFDVEHDPRRYRIRLMGTRIVSWYGCDLTGRYLDEIDFGDAERFTFAILDQVVDHMAPAHMSGEYTKQDGRRIRYERLYLPLSEDGRTVNMLLGAAVRLPPDAPILGDSLDM
jgi:hypothetical protein